MSYPFVLASASPRRARLLNQIGLSFAVIPPNIDESRLEGETISEYVVRLAREKAFAVDDSRAILAADTVVQLDDQLLGKPKDRQDAYDTLSRLSGRSHLVLTGLAVRKGREHVERLIVTEVWFRSITASELAQYVATGEPDDKSGSYGIQGIGGIFVQRIRGSADNVAGLPLLEAEELLRSLGVDTWHVREH